ncbi:hypothetical protein RSP822_18165 [Ralstonia solanacearum]|uniref:hypothetical protein n=1 Tax=Ralstonia solanacearum TaxID=305 RepID=UPI000E6670D2|nr:hypothetical protein [Ralstonia solanacearum]RIJ84993.1 hypothetical protein RSP822_18165 [Ralstonia solanacearum]
MSEITFTPDSSAVVVRKVQDAFNALGVLHGAAKKPNQGLDIELATNALKVAEFNIADLCKVLGVETDSAAEREERYAALRQANLRIRDLENQLGLSQAPEAVQASLKAMDEHLNKWWDLEGFGYIKDIDFGRYGCRVNFSCNLFGAFGSWDSDTPVTDRDRKAAWIENLKERGFVLFKDDRDWHLLDCDASRDALRQLIAGRIPSANVRSFENFHRRNDSGYCLRSAEAFISNISEILQLPTEVLA